jgi:hypothetical protein
MSWIWGEKKPKENVKMDFRTTPLRKDIVGRNIKLHLALEVEYPQNSDIVQAIRDTIVTFALPEGLVVKNTNLTHIELLNYTDAE